MTNPLPDLSDLIPTPSPTRIYYSKYQEAWEILKKTKTLSLSIADPKTERTIRKAIIERKKLDKDKDPLERISVRKEIKDGQLVLNFTLSPAIRWRSDFYDL